MKNAKKKILKFKSVIRRRRQQRLRQQTALSLIISSTENFFSTYIHYVPEIQQKKSEEL